MLIFSHKEGAMENYDPEIYNREGLGGLTIYELRDLARNLGVVSPTSKDKNLIIEEILQIVYGVDYDADNLTKGRPVKHRSETEWIGIFGNGQPSEVFYDKMDRNFLGAHSFVASQTAVYTNDAKVDNNALTHGVVVDENYQFRAMAFDSSGYSETKLIPMEFIEQYDLHVGSVITYRHKDGVVTEIITED